MSRNNDDLPPARFRLDEKLSISARRSHSSFPSSINRPMIIGSFRTFRFARRLNENGFFI
jgi:hypothetical protein